MCTCIFVCVYIYIYTYIYIYIYIYIQPAGVRYSNGICSFPYCLPLHSFDLVLTNPILSVVLVYKYCVRDSGSTEYTTKLDSRLAYG